MDMEEHMSDKKPNKLKISHLPSGVEEQLLAQLKQFRLVNDELKAELAEQRMRYAMEHIELLQRYGRESVLTEKEFEKIRLQVREAEKKVVDLERENQRIEAEIRIAEMTREAEARLDELRKKVVSDAHHHKDEERKQQFLELGTASSIGFTKHHEEVILASMAQWMKSAKPGDLRKYVEGVRFFVHYLFMAETQNGDPLHILIFKFCDWLQDLAAVADPIKKPDNE